MTASRERSLLITLRVESGTVQSERSTVTATRYHVSGEPALDERRHVAGIEETCELVRAWLEAFDQAG